MTKDEFSLCYQCGKCSAGCPVADQMDILPHQIMHLLALGKDEQAMKANSAWMCASCFTCAVRCPNDIDITTILDDLRSKAVARGVKCPKPSVLTFHRTFIDNIVRRGRIHELRLMGEYNLRSGKPFNNAQLAPPMLLKGRLRLMPPKRLRGFRKWIRRLWKK